MPRQLYVICDDFTQENALGTIIFSFIDISSWEVLVKQAQVCWHTGKEWQGYHHQEMIMIFVLSSPIDRHRDAVNRGYPAKRALSAMRKHGGYGPFGRIPSKYKVQMNSSTHLCDKNILWMIYHFDNILLYSEWKKNTIENVIGTLGVTLGEMWIKLHFRWRNCILEMPSVNWWLFCWHHHKEYSIGAIQIHVMVSLTGSLFRHATIQMAWFV